VTTEHNAGPLHYPEALSLADYLDLPHVGQHRSAAELRRQHEVIAEMLEALKALTVAVTFADPPKEFNGVLCHEARVPVGFVDAARAAIAKAEGVKPPQVEGYNTNRDQPTVTIKEVKP
jgi:hypothetical protein